MTPREQAQIINVLRRLTKAWAGIGQAATSQQELEETDEVERCIEEIEAFLETTPKKKGEKQ